MKATNGVTRTSAISSERPGLTSTRRSERRTMAISPGDVVINDFIGATGTKRRPTIVVSSDLYHAHRPDLVLASLTTRLATATTPMDYVLQDWSLAGLH